MGVSGFLISCARRRATSRQAATFCARISGVTSSNTSTTPSDAPLSPTSAVATAARWISWPSRVIAISCADGSATARPRSREQARPAARRSGRSNTASAGWPTIVRRQAEQPRRRAVDRRHRAAAIDRHDAGRNPFQDRLDVAAALFHFEMLPFEIDRRAVDLPAARRQLARHRVERLDQRAELVVALRLHVLIQPARADFAGGRREHQHRPRDPLRQIRAHPGGAEQNQQRHHEKERQGTDPVRGRRRTRNWL